jgi:hypothetical protein
LNVAGAATAPETGSATASVVAVTTQHASLAIAIAIVISFVLAIVEVQNGAKKKASTRACLVVPSLLYFTILAFGNVVATLLASVIVASKLSNDLKNYYFLFSAFFGLFAFQVVLKNTNISVFEKGVLTIDAWTKKALDAAVEAALAQQLLLDGHQQNALQALLEDRSEGYINALVLVKLGDGEVKKLDEAALSGRADTKLYKILQLATNLGVTDRQTLLKELKRIRPAQATPQEAATIDESRQSPS